MNRSVPENPPVSQTDHEILTALRIEMAEIRVEMRSTNVMLREALVSREHLDARLKPITENMDRWKGALTIITIIAGSIGATVATGLKHLFGVSP